MMTKVTLSVELNIEHDKGVSLEEVQGAAYWLLQPLLEDSAIEGRDIDINGCTIKSFNIDVDESDNPYEDTGETCEGYLDVTLEDDSTSYGGVEFHGQTLRDFLDSVEVGHDAPLSEVNEILAGCGIRPIRPV